MPYRYGFDQCWDQLQFQEDVSQYYDHLSRESANVFILAHFCLMVLQLAKRITADSSYDQRWLNPRKKIKINNINKWAYWVALDCDSRDIPTWFIMLVNRINIGAKFNELVYKVPCNIKFGNSITAHLVSHLLSVIEWNLTRTFWNDSVHKWIHRRLSFRPVQPDWQTDTKRRFWLLSWFQFACYCFCRPFHRL